MRREVSGGVFGGGVKTVAAVASTGAALVSILTFLNHWGLLGTPTMRETVANSGAHWVGIRPAVDTARAVNDTLHLAATITDKNGSLLDAARVTWASENPSVATVAQDGSVIARGAGATTILAVIGELSARSRIVVHQTVSTVRIQGDSSIAMAEGDIRRLEVRAFDRRGWLVPPRAAQWTVSDGSAVAVDSTGTVRGADVGRAILSVTLDGMSAQTLVNVAPAPAAIAIVKGDGQRAPAGRALSDRVIVRVVNRRGHPVVGTLVRFRGTAGDGVVDPAAVVTDADGRARTTWTLGDRPGRQRLLASVERVDSALVIGAEAEPSAANTRISMLRDTVSGVVGQEVESGVGIRITDSTGRALPDVRVTWTSLDGGSVQAVAERTDSLGEVRARWTLGRKAAPQRVRARLAGDIAPVTVTAVARHAAPASIALQRAKSMKPDDTGKIPVIAIVKDSFGNVVPRATIRLLSRTGTITPATIESDSAGRVSALWTLAAKVADQLLVASVRGGQLSDTLVVKGAVSLSAHRTKQAGRPRSPR
jgi:hypothetical protein